MKLADRIFEHQHAADELFEVIQGIVGEDANNCLKPGFKWQIKDVSWDEYDISIEVIFQDDADPLTTEKVKKILDLGFVKLYETRGDKGFLWNQDSSSGYPVGPNTSTKDRSRVAVLLRKIKELESAIGAFHRLD